MGVYKVKQLIIARKDLGMNKGKLSAQVAHASMGACLTARRDCEDGIYFDYESHPDIKEWLNGSFAKVVLAVNSKEELQRVYDIACDNDLLCAYIVDNGTTVFNGVPTPTCVGIGPAQSDVLDRLFGDLKLY